MIKVIKTEEEYEKALQKLYRFMQGTYVEGSPEADEAEVWAMLIENYENKHYPIPPPHPLAAIQFQLEQLTLDDATIEALLGDAQSKAAILSGERKLDLPTIRQLNRVLKIPAQTLIAEY
jgi:HTH-type transcriptional regulator / antitoxin HigA